MGDKEIMGEEIVGAIRRLLGRAEEQGMGDEEIVGRVEVQSGLGIGTQGLLCVGMGRLLGEWRRVVMRGDGEIVGRAEEGCYPLGRVEEQRVVMVWG